VLVKSMVIEGGERSRDSFWWMIMMTILGIRDPRFLAVGE
jgi:hypothetical protein